MNPYPIGNGETAMNKRDTVLIELQITFDAYVRCAVREVSHYTKYAIEVAREDGVVNKDKDRRTARNPHLEELLSVSAIEDADLANLEKAIKRTASWMKSYEHNYVFNNTSAINTIRKAIEQLASIYRISSAYPDNAIKRATQLRIDINKRV
jgi:tRNA U34 5-carboxymethylaminomethyl modifying GTPase MnmE/TrmE